MADPFPSPPRGDAGTPGSERPAHGTVRSEDGCELVFVEPGSVLRVVVTGRRATEPDTRAEAVIDLAWAERVRSNPRLFDGPIFALEAVNHREGVVSARVDSFRRLVAGPEAGVRVTVVGVTALVVRRRPGATEVLLGKRSPHTRVYGGLWEIGPSGGLDVGGKGCGHGAGCDPTSEEPITLEQPAICQQVLVELAEEAGVTRGDLLRPPRLVGTCADPIASSFELVHAVEVSGTLGERSWEYDDIRWVPTADAAAWDDASLDRVIPPSRLMLRHLPLLLGVEA